MAQVALVNGTRNAKPVRTVLAADWKEALKLARREGKASRVVVLRVQEKTLDGVYAIIPRNREPAHIYELLRQIEEMGFEVGIYNAHDDRFRHEVIRSTVYDEPSGSDVEVFEIVVNSLEALHAVKQCLQSR